MSRRWVQPRNRHTRTSPPLLAAAALLALGLSISGSATAGDQDDRRLDQAQALIDGGNAKQAVSLLAKNPGNPSARRACVLGHAYAELSDLPRAHLHLARCADGPGQEEDRLRLSRVRTELRRGSFAPVTLLVSPNTVVIEIVPALSGDSITSDDALWLPPGTHEFRATADGHVPATSKVEVTSTDRMSISLSLTAESGAADSNVDFGEDPGQELGTVSTVNDPKELEHETLLPDRYRLREESPSRPGGSGNQHRSGDDGSKVDPWPWASLGAASAATVAGVVMHARAIGAERDADRLEPGAERDKLHAAYRRRRNWAFALYGVGAACTALGLYMLVRDSEPTPPIAVSADEDGVTAQLSWTF